MLDYKLVQDVLNDLKFKKAVAEAKVAGEGAEEGGAAKPFGGKTGLKLDGHRHRKTPNSAHALWRQGRQWARARRRSENSPIRAAKREWGWGVGWGGEGGGA